MSSSGRHAAVSRPGGRGFRENSLGTFTRCRPCILPLWAPLLLSNTFFFHPALPSVHPVARSIHRSIKSSHDRPSSFCVAPSLSFHRSLRRPISRSLSPRMYLFLCPHNTNPSNESQGHPPVRTLGLISVPRTAPQARVACQSAGLRSCPLPHPSVAALPSLRQPHVSLPGGESGGGVSSSGGGGGGACCTRETQVEVRRL